MRPFSESNRGNEFCRLAAKPLTQMAIFKRLELQLLYFISLLASSNLIRYKGLEWELTDKRPLKIIQMRQNVVLNWTCSPLITYIEFFIVENYETSRMLWETPSIMREADGSRDNSIQKRQNSGMKTLVSGSSRSFLFFLFFFGG